MTGELLSATVGDLVASDLRTADVFERYGIDFCCGGRQTLGEACRRAAADPAAVVRDLDALPAEEVPDEDASLWPLDRLIDHIVSVHHAYVREALPRLDAWIAKLASVHGARHPELPAVYGAFRRLRAELEQHMMKEEQILFPYVLELADRSVQMRPTMSPFGSVENPIRMMEREHRDAGDELLSIREMTCGYRAPSDGCTTYNVCMAELAAFERDLHRHIHLENNILFPRAIALERRPNA
jgi:regulator of cell morphogenesis and NO signaling